MRQTRRDVAVAEASALACSLLTPAPRRIARSGPSVLYIPEQRPAGEANWNWCAPPDAAARRGMQRSPSRFCHSQGPRHEGRGGAGERVGARRDAARGGRGAGRGDSGAAARHRACQPAARGGAARGGRAPPSGARRGRRGACRTRAARSRAAVCAASACTDEDARLSCAAAAAERQRQREGQAVVQRAREAETRAGPGHRRAGASLRRRVRAVVTAAR